MKAPARRALRAKLKARSDQELLRLMRKSHRLPRVRRWRRANTIGVSEKLNSRSVFHRCKLLMHNVRFFDPPPFSFGFVQFCLRWNFGSAAAQIFFWCNKRNWVQGDAMNCNYRRFVAVRLQLLVQQARVACCTGDDVTEFANSVTWIARRPDFAKCEENFNR